MNIVCLGGGPAGLYFSILAKKANALWDISVVERAPPRQTFQWGLLFADTTLCGLREADVESHAAIAASLRHWDDIDIHFKGRKITSGGHRFRGIARGKLLEILRERASMLGVTLLFETEAGDPGDYSRNFDLVVAADGAASTTRRKYEDIFKPNSQLHQNRFLCLSGKIPLSAYIFDFKETECGWFHLHAYPVDGDYSTFVVEATEKTWMAAGIDKMHGADSIALCERLFEDRLQGTALTTDTTHLSGSKLWMRFNQILCEKWHYKNIVLLGDAAHTARLGVGSGAGEAMEDGIALAAVLASDDENLSSRLQRYQDRRAPAALQLQGATLNWLEWFEHVDRYVHLAPEQFSYSLLTATKGLGHEGLKRRDPQYVAMVEKGFGARSGLDQDLPPMYTPFSARGVTLKNRVIVSPSSTYMAVDGVPNDFHLVNLGARAQGPAAMVMTEMICVTPDARITPGCPGLWNDEQQNAWKRICDYVHTYTGARIALQLGHAGRKGSTRRAWDGIDQPLASGNWPLISASAIPYIEGVSQVPREATHADLDRIKADFAAATRRAIAAGFDWLELQCAHGYFLSSFISPITNQRTDDYGGSVEHRCQYPLEVFRAVRAVWPPEKPISVRLSVHDWIAGGMIPEIAVRVACAFKAAGADVIDCSSGQVSKEEKPETERMFQVQFSDRIRNEGLVPTIAEVNDFESDRVNTIIAAGRADLCAIAPAQCPHAGWPV